MSIDESIDAWRFLERPSRFPFLTNGAGDYVGYETAKKGRGARHSHWHDDTESALFAKSLDAHIARLTKEYGELEVDQRQAVTVGKPAVWIKVTRLPNIAQLAKRPIGTLFRYYEPRPTIRGTLKVLQVFAKVGESLWALGTGENDGAAVVRINEVLPKPFSHGWPNRDEQVHSSLDFACSYHKVAIEESSAAIAKRARVKMS